MIYKRCFIGNTIWERPLPLYDYFDISTLLFRFKLSAGKDQKK